MLSLLSSFKTLGKWIQIWSANVSSCVADLPSLQTWLEELLLRDPDYGYHPELSKIVLVVDPSNVKQNCLQILGLRLFLVDDFLVDLLVMIF